MDDIRIRKAVQEDLEVLLQFEQALIAAERPMDPTIREGHLHYYDLGAFLRDPEATVLVAECQGRLVGSGYAISRAARPYLNHKQYAYLGFMYTVPEFRGKGVNQRIIATLKEWAIAHGLHEMRLTVYETNVAAIRAYEKAGFGKHLMEMRLTTQQP